MQINRWLIGGLILSLVVNLLLVGVVIGRMSGGHGHGMGPDPTTGFFRVLGFLSDERRAEIAADLRDQMRDLIPVLRRMRGNQRHVFETLTAEPFDPARLEQALADLRTDLTTAQVSSHRSFVEVAKSMTLDERKALADAMRQGARMHRGRSSAEGSRQGDRAWGKHRDAGGIESPQESR
jgi:uncharacterized membrane protein